MANEVATITDLEITNLTPAHIEVPNLDDLVAGTDSSLAQYREFPVTEESYDTAKELRTKISNTIKNISSQRKNIEEQVLGNWPDIKNKMMSIEKQGKQASDLLKSQMVPVENERKERRREVVMNDVVSLANEQNVDWLQIQFNEKWLNKTYSRNDMLSEINSQISQIKKDDELRALKISQIEVEAGSVGVSPEPYIAMLAYRDLADVKSQIHRDVEIKQAKLNEAKRVQEETIKRQQEREANAKQVGDKLVDENGEVVTPAKAEPKVYTRTLHVTGTSAQLNKLAKFMRTSGMTFEGE